MFKDTHFVYLARPLDFNTTAHPVLEARSLLRGAGLAFYDPGAAFELPAGARPNPTINAVNQAALDACGGVLAIMPPAGSSSIGVPMEIERARGQGKPVLVVADLATVERSWALQSVSMVDPNYKVVLPNELRERDTRWLGIRLEQARTPRPVGSEPMFFVVEEGGRLPTKSYGGDAGFDLFTTGDWTINPGDNLDVPCGVSVQLPAGVWAMIVGRSSTIRKHGLQVQPGVIDQGYRGPLYANIQNLNPLPVEIKDGQRLAQLIPFPLTSATVHAVSVDVLAESDRGTAGFGSSGA